MLSTLHPALRASVPDLHRQFTSAQPFHHVVIDQFLDPAFCRDLIDSFPPFADKVAINERGEVGRKAVVSDLARIGTVYQQFDRLMKDPEFLSVIGEITGIPSLLYDPEYIGGGTHENLDGQELDTHVDFNYHPTTHLHRRLNLILFLNPEWEAEWGGCLELLRDPFATGEADVKSVVPLANRAVIFETTEASWHGFQRIRIPSGKQISRRSIAVYFYTNERPADQTAPSHATIYYQRPLPDHIQSGYTLQPADVLEIQILLKRRDTFLKFLYDRELEFSEALAGRDSRIRDLEDEIAGFKSHLQAINDSPTVRLAKAITWPARKLRALVRKQ
ncbi:MAG TPA: 2OG-Fe(II) oxygenase [Bryobacteraceae bacterium]|nr:2OG-Fe(II) oxygenase [Bryobacteraceae bacterium]